MTILPLHRLLIASSFFIGVGLLFGLFGFSALHVEGQYTPHLDLPGDDYCFVFSTGDELSHMMLWHDLKGHGTTASQADVLVLGNSRTQLGLLAQVIAPKLQDAGMSAFWLATGHGEKYSFFFELFKKYNFSNKIVLIQDALLTSEKISGPARIAMSSSRWKAMKKFYEAQAGWALERWLHHVVPKLRLSSDFVSRHVLYRSLKTGGWFDCLAYSRKKRIPVSTSQQPLGITETAMEFIRYVQKQNAVVITAIPNSYNSTADSAEEFAKRIGAAYVRPRLDGLFTYDKSHLHPESAGRFSIDFCANAEELLVSLKRQLQEQQSRD